MEKLMQKYDKEFGMISRKSNNIWKIGIIILLILFVFSYYYTKKYFLIYIMLMIGILSLYLVCEVINIRNMKKILMIKGKCKKRNIYIELDKYQKNWIVNYCKKNKINRIKKINIIRDELKSKDKESAKRYIDPIIMATLLLNIWEIIVQTLTEKFGLINAIIMSIALAIVITVIIGFGRKEYKEQKEFFNMFKRMTGNKRLDELLIYVAMKCKD